MMSVLEYATDVNKTIEEILKLCKKLDINCNTEDDMLSEDDIIVLDNEISNEDDIEDIDDIIEEDILDDQRARIDRIRSLILQEAFEKISLEKL